MPPPPEELRAFMDAISSTESSHNYRAVGADQGSPYGVALGRYQVMSNIVPGWARQAGYGTPSREEWLGNPKLQEAVVSHRMSYYYDKYGDWDLVAVAWFGGEGKANKAARDGIQSLKGVDDGFIDVPEYVRRVKAAGSPAVPASDRSMLNTASGGKDPRPNVLDPTADPDVRMDEAPQVASAVLANLSRIVQANEEDEGMGDRVTQSMQRIWRDSLRPPEQAPVGGQAGQGAR